MASDSVKAVCSLLLMSMSTCRVGTQFDLTNSMSLKAQKSLAPFSYLALADGIWQSWLLSKLLLGSNSGFSDTLKKISLLFLWISNST